MIYSLSQRLPVQSVQRGLVVALSNVVGRVVQAGASWAVGHSVSVECIYVGGCGRRGLADSAKTTHKNAESANLSLVFIDVSLDANRPLHK